MQRPYIPACTCPHCGVELVFENFSAMGQAYVPNTRWVCSRCKEEVTDAVYGVEAEKPKEPELVPA
jgi:transposase-like protein